MILFVDLLFPDYDYSVLLKGLMGKKMKHGKNFTLGEYVIIKKPELMEIGDNVRIADFCRISTACKIGNDCEIAPGVYIAGAQRGPSAS